MVLKPRPLSGITWCKLHCPLSGVRYSGVSTTLYDRDYEFVGREQNNHVRFSFTEMAIIFLEIVKAAAGHSAL